MFCKFVEKNLSAYLDQETGRPAACLISRHLAVCPSCRTKLTFYSAISKTLKQKEKFELGPEFTSLLKARIALENRSGQKGAAGQFQKQAFMLKLGLGAFFLVFVFSGILFFLGGSRDKAINEFSTIKYQTKTEIIKTGYGLEFSTFTKQTRR